MRILGQTSFKALFGRNDIKVRGKKICFFFFFFLKEGKRDEYILL